MSFIFKIINITSYIASTTTERPVRDINKWLSVYIKLNNCPACCQCIRNFLHIRIHNVSILISFIPFASKVIVIISKIYLNQFHTCLLAGYAKWNRIVNNHVLDFFLYLWLAIWLMALIELKRISNKGKKMLSYITFVLSCCCCCEILFGAWDMREIYEY